jgi:TonB family protein
MALSKTRPKGVGGHGTAKVKFVILPSGSLDFVEVTSSSGNSNLDHKAIEAVRHTSFPTPPAGMTVTQLTYEVPYHFR